VEVQHFVFTRNGKFWRWT